MRLESIKDKLPARFYEIAAKEIDELRPCQEKAVKEGLLESHSLLVTTPTASGKTFVAEMVAAKSILSGKGKTVYIVPLKALAVEKYKEFKRKYGSLFSIALSIGDFNEEDRRLANYDLIITTSEKLDSLIRHRAPWIITLGVIIIDEIHLLNDPRRGPTLEIIITILKRILKNIQIVGLSATIGNPDALADWLDAKLIDDDWRPVELKEGVYREGKLRFYSSSK